MRVHCLHQVLLLLLVLGSPAGAVRAEDGSLSERNVVPCGSLEKYGVEVGLAVGGYTLDECLGGGAFGEAWKATATAEGTVVLKILKTPRGQADFRGQRADENLLKECLYGHAMKLRDPAHFVDCRDVGSFTAHQPGSEPTELMYSVSDLVAGRNLQDVLANTVEAPDEIPKLNDAVAVVLDLMAAVNSTVEGDPKFFHNDLQPSNLMLSSAKGALKVTALDYGEAVICCVDPGPECALGSDEVREKLDLSYGKSLDQCSAGKREFGGKSIAAAGLKETARLLALDVLLLLCKPASARKPPFSLLMQLRGGEADEFVEQVFQSMRSAYAEELKKDTRDLLEEALRSLYEEVEATYNDGMWPWKSFREKLEVLQEKLV